MLPGGLMLTIGARAFEPGAGRPGSTGVRRMGRVAVSRAVRLLIAFTVYCGYRGLGSRAGRQLCLCLTGDRGADRCGLAG